MLRGDAVKLDLEDVVLVLLDLMLWLVRYVQSDWTPLRVLRHARCAPRPACTPSLLLRPKQ